MFTDDFLLLRYLCTSEYSLGARGFLREESQSGDKRNGEEREESFVSPLLSLSSFIATKENLRDQGNLSRLAWNILWQLFFCRLCGFEPFYDERGDQAMFQRILKCDWEFVAPWWDDVSESAKVYTLTCYVSEQPLLVLFLTKTKSHSLAKISSRRS